ncbi:MAG: carboxypeptidase regulatory-like domain-containing protein [Candidatus Heimdallarchaeota archaeon]|nr:carboxypeptidase regulatory-like domain-containing protein [Candidatus Heimdallarchaeota archaeon]
MSNEEIPAIKSEEKSGEETQDAAQDLASKIFSPERLSDLMGIGGTQLDNIAWHDFSEYNYIIEPEIVSDENNPDYLKDLIVFKPNSINLGLRIVYRQEWRPLGNQRGEIVKTIPLGPKQVEKVSTKIIRRAKIAKTAENLKSIETTTEMSETTKDSSEIINEASSSFNWHLETDASHAVDVGITKGSVSIEAGMGGELANKTTATNQKLSEIMQKTASKMRSETKTVVNTESESTFELVTASEIQNPNDEIAITYVYSKLQRQYEVFTSVAEIHNVIMIAMAMPEKIDFTWVKEHDWILAKVLLDDSYRDALSEISVEADMSILNLDDLEGKLEETKAEALGKVSTIGSITGTDFLRETEGYRDIIKEKIERKKQDHVNNAKKERLYKHIENNILHYMRAIWSHDDPQQRLLRIQKLGIKVPNQWFFKGVFGSLDVTDSEFGIPIYDIYDLVVAYELGEEITDDQFQDQLETEIAQELEALEIQMTEERDSVLENRFTEIETTIHEELDSQIDELIQRRDSDIAIAKQNIVDEVTGRNNARLQDLINQVNAALQYCYDRYYYIRNHFNNHRWYPEEEFKRSVDKNFASIYTGTSRLKTRVDLLKESVFTALNLVWRKELRKESSWLASLKSLISAGQALETQKNNLQQTITQNQANEIAQAQAVAETNITNSIQIQIDSVTNIINDRITEEKQTAQQEIFSYYEKHLRNAMIWLENKIRREHKSGIIFDGDFNYVPGSYVDLIEVINPAGPIGFHGNYAIFYLKPELVSSDINAILTILKVPYLHFESIDLEPMLVDPLLKLKMKEFSDLEPSEDEKYDMLDYIPEIRMKFALTEDIMSAEAIQLTYSMDATAILLDDKQLFIDYYPEYLFRKELTRRFVVDTNNLILDIEPGFGSTLEPYKLAHRGVDVQKAYEEKEKLRLENLRLKNLLLQKKLDARSWSDDQKYIIIDDDDEPSLPFQPGTPQPEPIIQPTSVAKAYIFGQIQKEDSKEPINNAQIKVASGNYVYKPFDEQIDNTLITSVKSSTHGLYSINLDPGKYKLIISAKGYKPRTKTISVHYGKSKEYCFDLKKLKSTKGYIGNKETQELHKKDCPWLALMHDDNKRNFDSVKDAKKDGYNGCYHCLKKQDTG